MRKVSGAIQNPIGWTRERSSEHVHNGLCTSKMTTLENSLYAQALTVIYAFSGSLAALLLNMLRSSGKDPNHLPSAKPLWLLLINRIIYYVLCEKLLLATTMQAPASKILPR